MASISDSVSSNNTFILKLQTSTPGTFNPRDLHTGLLLAAKLGHVECVQCLVDAGADIEFVNPSNSTPLIVAIQNKQVGVVKLLLGNGCAPNFRGNSQSTPLHIASRSGNSDIVDDLIAAGAGINDRDSAGNTPLILSVQNCQYSVMKSLIKAKCDLNAANHEGLTALHYACYKARGFQVLLDAGADPDVRDNHNITPLFMAATEGFDGVVKALVEKNCDVNVPNDSVKRTALHILSYKGHKDCINSLVYGGANIHACDIYNRTPLWYAIKNQKIEVVRLLLKAYSHVDAFQCSAESTSEDCPANLSFGLRLFDVVKYLILTGYDHCHVRSCIQRNEYSDWLSTNKDFTHWLEFASGAPTLKQLCRKWIRHHLGLQFYHNLQTLPLPDMLKDYLLLEELHY